MLGYTLAVGHDGLHSTIKGETVPVETSATWLDCVELTRCCWVPMLCFQWVVHPRHFARS
jgi:hypothetical protein